jgi:RNA polymerase sigma factor FliA
MSTAQDTARRDELIIGNLHLVQIIASHVRRSLSVHTEMDDLVHAGTMGLFDAATKYREDREVAFPVYAKHRIRGAILDSLRQIDWASRDARKTYKQMQSVARDLSLKLQRSPTQAEIAEAMGIDEHRWQTLMIDFRSLGLSASRQSSSNNEELPTREVPATAEYAPDSAFFLAEMRATLNSALGCLPERYQKVVKLYYDEDMTMKEIGNLLGVNESRVSQIHKAALAKMQIHLGVSGIACTAALC